MNAADFIDSAELAKHWSLPESWIRDQTRSRVRDPIPCMRFGRYVRFDLASPELRQWLERRRAGVNHGPADHRSLQALRAVTPKTPSAQAAHRMAPKGDSIQIP